MITNYSDYCIICGHPASDIHHLVFGFSKRKLADADELTAPLCHEHHELMHNKRDFAACSQIMGQLLYERNKCAEGYTVDAARDSFRIRYGKSYL